MIRIWPIDETLDGERCDVGLSRLTGESRANCVTLIEQSRVTINSKVAQKSARLSFGDVIEVDLPDPDLHEAEPTVVLPIVFEDDSFVVIDKPAGVAAHPSQGWSGPTVTGSLEAMGTVLTSYGPSERKGIVHRLDVGTSGLMVVAKNEIAYSNLKDQFRDRTVSKVYHALVQGHIDPTTGTIDAPIDRHPREDYRFAVVANGKPSITHYKTLEVFPAVSLMEIELETGRTHQIRVHFSALHHPLVGDLTYGADPSIAQRLQISRPWLHAKELAFNHPATGERISFNAQYPADLTRSLSLLADNQR